MNGTALRLGRALPMLLPLLTVSLLGSDWRVAAESSARSHVVEIRGFEYQPQRLEVAVGDTVVWINRDAAPHTASAADGSWDSGRLAADERFEKVFTSAAEVRYLCALHPGMQALVRVD